jgi:hypothetical protein
VLPSSGPIAVLTIGGRRLLRWDDVVAYRWWRSLTEEERAAAQADEAVADLLRDRWTWHTYGHVLAGQASAHVGDQGEEDAGAPVVGEVRRAA